MVRTVSEEPCNICMAITNWYDQSMGRLCPKCTAQMCANFGRSLSNQVGIFSEPASMEYLAEGNKDLLTMPLIDHDNDIDFFVESIDGNVEVIPKYELKKRLTDIILKVCKSYWMKETEKRSSDYHYFNGIVDALQSMNDALDNARREFPCDNADAGCDLICASKDGICPLPRIWFLKWMSSDKLLEREEKKKE